MTCTVRHEGSTSIIDISGRFVFDQHRAFKESYDAARERAETQLIRLEMSGVEYLDSSALGMMLLMKERAEMSGKKIQIKGANAFVRQLLETANFHKLFDMT